MVKVTRNGWMEDEVYLYVMDCLSKDLGCDPTEQSVSNALSVRTGYDVTLDFTHQCKIYVSGDFDTADEYLIMDELETDNNSPEDICAYIYGRIDKCIESVRSNDHIAYAGYELYDNIDDRDYDDHDYGYATDDSYDEYWGDWYY